jgi:hypothetical protein
MTTESIPSGFKKILVFLLLCIPPSFLLLTPGFYEPQDLHHLADIYQMVRAIGSGQIPPRLGPDYMFGYGYPLFNFYYPLPFYLGALFFSLIGSLTISFKLVFIVSIVVSIFGMYLFLKEFLDEWGAVVGSVLFLYTPYRAVQIYVRGAMGEALALSLLPIFAWSIVKLLKKPNIKTIALAGILGGVFILSHNYFWALSVPWLIALIFVVKYKEKVSTLTKLALGGIISLALTAYWWLSALVEQKLVSKVTPFPLIDHFPFIKQLIIPSWGYGASLWGPSDGMSFQIGVVNLIVTLFLVLFLILRFRELKNKNLLNLSIWVMGGIVVSVFLMNIRSYPVWKLLPFHDFVQFPWRLLCFTTFFTSIVAGILVSAFLGKKKYLFGVLVVAASILLTVNYFKPSQKFYKSDNDYLNRFFANRSLEGQKDGTSKEYLLYSEDYLQLPYWVKERPKDIPISKISSLDSKVSGIIEINPIFWQASVESSKPGTVVFHEIYFPGWVAEVDGKRVPVSPGGPNGEMIINIKGGGVQKIRFFWQETPLRKAADMISLGAITIVILIFIFSKKQK